MPMLKNLAPGTLIQLPGVDCVYRVKGPFAGFAIEVHIPNTEHTFIWGEDLKVDLVKDEKVA